MDMKTIGGALAYKRVSFPSGQNIVIFQGVSWKCLDFPKNFYFSLVAGRIAHAFLG